MAGLIENLIHSRPKDSLTELEPKKLSCYLIGSTSLLVECAEELIANNVSILGVLSKDPFVIDWLKQKNFEHITNIQDFEKRCQQQTADYLFSIISAYIVPNSILNTCHKFAINYHDAPLPQYAGVHATSWAIYNNEKTHGISWHLMTDVLDQGDILLQATCPIAADETTLSLNIKCYQLAIKSFKTLLKQLLSDQVNFQQQDLSKRTYHGLHDKLPGYALVNWDMSAETILRIFRATHFGHFRNKFCKIKFHLFNQYFTFHDCNIIQNEEAVDASTILEISSNEIKIKTADNVIAIRNITDQSGNPWSIKQLTDEYTLSVGMMLPDKNIHDHCFNDLVRQYSINESYWIEKLLDISPASFDACTTNSSNNKMLEYKAKISFSKANQYYPDLSFYEFICALIFIYLYRTGNKQNCYIGLQVEPHNQLLDLVSHLVPLNFALNEDMVFSDVLKLAHHNLVSTHEHSSFLKNIFIRIPELDTSSSRSILAPDVVITDNAKNIEVIPQATKVVFCIDSHKGCLQILSRSLDRDELKAILNRLKMIAVEVMLDNKSLNNYQVITNKERRKLTGYWNRNSSGIPKVSIDEMFRSVAYKMPNSIAIYDNDTTLSYAELDAKSNRFARFLKGNQCQPGDTIALTHDRSWQTLVILLGILKAGCTYICVERNLPNKFIDVILEQSDARLFLMLTLDHPYTEYAKDQLQQKVMILTQELLELEKYSDDSVEVTSSPASLAYSIYTSGTTGNPKGMSIYHHSVVSLVKKQNYINIRTDDVIGHLSNLSFDATTFEVWGALLNGAAIQVIPYDDVLNIDTLTKHLNTRTTICFLTTSLISQLILLDPSIIANLRVVLFGGEASNPVIIRKLIDYLRQQNNKNLTLVHVYGPTECTTFATKHVVRPVDLEFDSIPIGSPLSNVNVYVLDENQQLLPPGVKGELYISGNGLSKGYIKNNELTKLQFVELAINNKFQRAYRTGDIVRWLPQGILEFIERQDSQVKIRGFRIQLSTIRRQLSEHDAIQEAYVSAKTHANGHKYIVAYLVANADHPQATTNFIDKYLRQRLADYMIPLHYVWLDQLPLTRQGKVNEKELPEPQVKRNIPQIATQLSFTEIILCSIWSESLKVERVGIDDNYFQLGGDSIIILDIIMRAKEHGLYINATDIFDYPTIRELASTVRRDLGQQVNVVNQQNVVMLNPIQKWFFGLELAHPEQFNQTVCIEINSQTELKPLREALNILINKHLVFRFYYVCHAGEWQQKVYPKDSPLICDINSISVADNLQFEAEISRLNQTFSLSEPPLIKVSYIENESNDTTHLVFVVHHLIIDGVSWRILLNSLLRFYRLCLNSNYSSDIQIDDRYLMWINQLSQQNVPLETQNSWLRIENYKMPLPRKPKINPLEKDSLNMSTTLEKEQTKNILNIPNHSRVSLYEILVAAFVKTLSMWIPCEMVVLDLESHARQSIDNGDIDLSQTIGWFTSLYPVAIRAASEDESYFSLANRVKLLLDSIENQGTSYGIFRYLIENKNTTSSSSRWVCFNYVGHYNSNHSNQIFTGMNDHVFKLNSHPENKNTHLLTVTCWFVDEEFFLDVRFNQHFFASEEIRACIDNYMEILLAFGESFENSHHNANKFDNYASIPLSNNQLKEFSTKYPDIASLINPSPLQRGLLFHGIKTHGRTYLNQFIWRHRGKLDIEKFSQSWQYVVDKHPELRTCFNYQISNFAVNVVNKNAEMKIKVFDLSDIEDATSPLNRLVENDYNIGIDLSKAPLMRTSIVKLSDSEHAILWTHHHALLDGWSAMRVLDEVYTCYNTEESRNFEHEEINHKTMIAEINHSSKESISYWKDYLKGYTGKPLTPHSNKSYDINDIKPRHLNKTLKMSREDSNLIRETAAEIGVSQNTLFQFAWMYILSQYLHSDDLIIGSTMETRPRENGSSDKFIGFHMNTLPYRFRYADNNTILLHLYAIQYWLLEMKQGKFPISLRELYRTINHSDDQDLFESIFIFENYPNLSSNHHEITNMSLFENPYHPVTCIIIPNDEFTCQLIYDANYFHEAEIENLLARIPIVIHSALSNLNNKVDTISMLSKQERELQINQSVAQLIGTYKINDLFLQQVNNKPNAIALIDNTGSISYLEMEKRISQITAYLTQQNVTAGDFIGVSTDKNIEAICILFAITRLRASYVFLDKKHPKDRLQYIANDAQLQFTLTDTHNLLDDPHKTIHISQMHSWIELHRATPPDATSIEQDLNDILYVMYTSGSTGNPKGVCIQQKAVINLIESYYNIIDVQQNECFLSISSLAFDISVLEIFGPLSWGSSVVLADASQITDTNYIASTIDKFAVTVMQGTPSFWHAHIQAGLSNLKNVKVLSGGDLLSHSLAKSILKCGASLINSYGPTETTVYSTATHIYPHDDVISIGNPINNTSLLIMNKAGYPLPRGFPGEIYIGGLGLAKEYLNKTQLTQEKFIFISNQRYYKTGDIVRRTLDDKIVYLGRIDNQIKLRSHRIELDEINRTLMKSPLIQQSTVLLIEAEDQKRLVAFVTAKLGVKQLNENDVKAALAETLPPYMVPHRIIQLNAFQLTVNGKVNTDRLKQQYFEILDEAQSTTSPEIYISAQEQMICDIFKSLTHNAQANPQTNFYDLGGDSLLVLCLLKKINELFNVKLGLHHVANKLTPRDLARLIEQHDELLNDTDEIQNPIICLQQGNPSKRPLFLIHPVGGTIFWFITLSKLMPKDRPIYAIQDPGLQLKKIPFQTIEQMAHYYLSQIEVIQSHGPYLLGGASFGGTVAIEIARQLKAKGEQVAFVGLLDSWAHYPESISERKFVEELTSRQHNDMLQKLGDKFDDNTLQPYLDLHWQRAKILSQYVHRDIECPVVLFKSRDTLDVLKPIESPHNHWFNWIKQFNIVMIPGDHETMFYSPNVSELAQKLNESLIEYETRQFGFHLETERDSNDQKKAEAVH